MGGFMKRFKQFKTRFLMIFLLSGILILSVSLIFISCGSGPQTKVLITNKGSYALDFSLAPQAAGIFVEYSNLPNLEGKEWTIEAWIKNKEQDDDDPTTTNIDESKLNGGIFSRFAGGGIAMWVKDNKLKGRIIINLGGQTFTYYSLVCDLPLDFNKWTHVAFSLTTEDQSSGPNDCQVDVGNKGQVVGKDIPHLACYVNGELRNCARTDGNYLQEDIPNNIYIGMIPFGKQLCDEVNPTNSGECVGFNFTNDQELDAIVDEVRFWTVGRKKDEIKECYNKKLSVTASGSCKIDPSILKGYWPFDEGDGTAVYDISGYGYVGTKFSPYGDEWKGGWVIDVPF
jgi:hypothetical protein